MRVTILLAALGLAAAPMTGLAADPITIKGYSASHAPAEAKRQETTVGGVPVVVLTMRSGDLMFYFESKNYRQVRDTVRSRYRLSCYPNDRDETCMHETDAEQLVISRDIGYQPYFDGRSGAMTIASKKMMDAKRKAQRAAQRDDL